MASDVYRDENRFVVGKVKIVHAGEDLDKVIRPLADILESKCKLPEQADYMRTFKDTSVTQHLRDCFSGQPETNTKLVLVISQKLLSTISLDKQVEQAVIQKLTNRDLNGSPYALVSVDKIEVQWGKGCLCMSNYVANIDNGALADGIFKQWFGPNNALPSQQDWSMCHDLSVYLPHRVKIVHAIPKDGDRTVLLNLRTSIDEVADPEKSTIFTLRFKPNARMAQLVLNDLEEFKSCCERLRTNYNAVFLWCPSMLQALDQCPPEKEKIISLLMEDNPRRQTLFAHCMYQLTHQQVYDFSSELWNFLNECNNFIHIPDLNAALEPCVRVFLKIWAGHAAPIRAPEESSDPSMLSLDSSCDQSSGSIIDSNPGLNHTGYQPQQNQRGDRMVVNNTSMSHSDAGLNRENDGGLLTDKWSPPNPARGMTNRGEQQVASTPFTLRGPVFADGHSSVGSVPPVRQPMANSGGHHKMATGSIGSVSVDSVNGRRYNGQLILGPAEGNQHYASLPQPFQAQPQPQPHQPRSSPSLYAPRQCSSNRGSLAQPTSGETRPRDVTENHLAAKRKPNNDPRDAMNWQNGLLENPDDRSLFSSLNCIDSQAACGTDNITSGLTSDAIGAENGGLRSTTSQEDTLMHELPFKVLRRIKNLLDPTKNHMNDWRDLASYFRVPQEDITYWKSQKSDCSPTENLISWRQGKNNDFTVEEFKDGLKKIVRNDVVRCMEAEGY